MEELVEMSAICMPTAPPTLTKLVDLKYYLEDMS